MSGNVSFTVSLPGVDVTFTGELVAALTLAWTWVSVVTPRLTVIVTCRGIASALYVTISSGVQDSVQASS